MDQSEPRSGPARRRHGADLLFRGYSSPVDLKTIELCCLRSQGCDGAVQDRLVALSKTESEDRQAEMCALLSWLFPFPALVHMRSVQADNKHPSRRSSMPEISQLSLN